MTNILWYCEGQGKCWTTFDTFFVPVRRAAACVCSACKNFTILTFRNLPLTLSCFISEIFQICSIIEYYICTLGKIEGRKLRIKNPYFTRGPHRDGGTWNQYLISTHSEWYDKYWVWSESATKLLMSRSPCRWPPALQLDSETSAVIHQYWEQAVLRSAGNTRSVIMNTYE